MTDVVLTTVPQTALTVSAATDDENQVIAEQQIDEQDPGSDSEIIDEEEEVSEGSEEPGEPAASEEPKTPEEPATPEESEEQENPEIQETPEEQETPEVPETPAVPEVPEEPAEETPADAAGIFSDDVQPLADECTITFKSTIDGEDMGEFAVDYGYLEELTGVSNGTVLDRTDVTFKVKVPESEPELKLAETNPVMVKIGKEEAAATADGDGYKIANSNGEITGNVVVTINLVTKTYTVNAPAEDTDKGVTWKIKKAGEAYAEDGASSVAVKRGEKDVVLQAALAAEKAPVGITVGEETKELTAGSAVEFDVTLTDENLNAAPYTIMAAVKAMAEVTITGKETTDTGFSTTYAVKKDGEFADADFKAVADGKITAYVGDVIGLKFTAPEGKSVKAVTGGAVTETEDGIWEYTVVAAAEGANALKVELQSVKAITVKGAADAKIKSVSYKLDGASAKNAVKSGTDWKISVPAEGVTSVTVTVTAEDHNEVVYIHGTGTHAATGECGGCVFTGPAAGVAETSAITAESIAAAGLELTVATRKITVPYIFNKADLTSARIVKADGTTEVAAETADGDNKGKYILESGETYYVQVSEADLEKVTSVTATDETGALKYYKNGFRFTATVNAAAAITITKKVEAAQEITVVYNNADGNTPSGTDFTAAIQADSYKTTSATVETGANTAKTNISTDSDAATTYSVWEGTPFTFAVTPQNDSYYKVEKVAVGEDAANATVITPADDKYTIAKASECTIFVTVALDTTKAESIKFTDVDGNVDAVTADLAGGSTYAAIELGTQKYFKAATEKKVTFKVTADTGYEVDSVKAGETDVPSTGTGADTVYTYTYADTTKSAEISIKTKATALAEDKFVKFVIAEDSGVEVKVDEKVKPVEKDNKPTTTYKLTQAKAAEGTNPAVAEISELAFDVIVPYGSYLSDTTFADGTIVRPTTVKRTLSEDKWVYSYKVVANQIAAGKNTEDNAQEITIAANSAAAESVTVKTKEVGQSVEYKNLNNNRQRGTLNSTGVTVNPGDVLVVTLADGQSAKLDGEACEVDEFGAFSFEAALDDEANDNQSTMVLDVTTAEAAAHVLKYAINPTGNTITYNNEVPADGISADIGDKVYVKLFDTEDNAVAISKLEKGEGADESSVTRADQTTKTGEAIIEVKNENISVDFYYEKEDNSGTITKVEDALAATLKIRATDGSQVKLTAKGISANKTLTLDATSVMTYPLTIKKGGRAVNAADYDNVLNAVLSDPTIANVYIEDGKLTVETLKGEDAETEVKIVAKGQAADAEPLLSFKIKGKTPALKVKSVDSPNQGVQDVLVNATADGGIKSLSDSFNYYYEIGVAAKEGVTNPSGSDIIGYYYLSAEKDGSGKLLPASQLVKVNKATAEAQTPNSYTVSVRIVAKAGAPLTDAQMGVPAAGTRVSQYTTTAADFASTAVVKKDFTTRVPRFENKLGVTKKTTKFYSGQDYVTVAIPKFSKDAGHINDIEAVVYNKDGSLADTDKIWTYRVDLNTMEVKVGTSESGAGNYDVVIYATANGNEDGLDGYDMYRASAKVPITVQKSINEIEVDPVDEIFIKDYGTNRAKDASFTLKPVGYYNYYSQGSSRNVKAQTQKFECKVDTFGNDKNVDKVVVKGNKITVKKDFYISNDPSKNTFDVNVYAADYISLDGGGRWMTSFTVTVTKNAMELGAVKLKVGNKTYADKGTLASEELNYAEVIVTDKAGREISPSLVDFTPNKGKIYVSKSYYGGKWHAAVRVSAYAKNLTIKATTRDGGKKSVSAKFNVGYWSGANFVLAHWSDGANSYVEGPTLSTGGTLTAVGRNSWSFKGSNDDKIRFTIVNKAVDENGEVDGYYQANKNYYNYTVKITGGKNTYSKTSETYGNYSIAPNKDGKVVISITDKTAPKGTKPVEFTITNTGWTSEKAPTAKTKDKLYCAYEPTGETAFTYIGQDLTFDVTGNTKGYNAVKLTWVSGNVTDISSYYTDEAISITNNQFTLSNNYVYGVGTEKYSLIYGKFDSDGNFRPMTKAATLSIKTNKVGNIKAVNKYTISTNVGYGVKLDAKPALKFKDGQSLVQYVGVLSANVKGADGKFGQRNQFFDYFEIVDGRLQIKTTKRTEAELAKLTKDDLTGYLVYRYVNNNGAVVTKQDKITVVINETGAPKYAATPINVVAAANVTAKTTITLGGEKVAIAPTKVAAADGSGWTATCTGDDAANGIVTLTAQTPASKNVDLYLIPADSKNASTGNALTDGIKVSVPVKTVSAEDAKTKVSLSRNAKVPTAAIVGGNSVELTAEFVLGEDFSLLWDNAALSDVTKLTAEEEAALTKADEKTGAAAVKAVTKNLAGDEKSFSVTFDRKDLPTTNGKKVYKVPVKLTFTAGKTEIVAFSVKPEVVPTMQDVENLIKKELVDTELQGCLVSDPNNATTAVSEVTAALRDVEIPALAGITAGGVAVKNAGTFADKPASGDTAAQTGDHLLKITLTDVTLAADAEGKTKDIDIKVVKKANLTEEITAAVDKWRVPANDGTVPEGKTAITATSPTAYDVRNAIQDAVDKVFGKNQYIVAVTDFNIATTEVSAPSTGTSSVNADAATVTKVTGMTFNYSVKDAQTGDDLDMNGTETFAVTAGVGAAAASVEVPTVSTSEPDPGPAPNPPADKASVASVAVAAAESAEEITQGTPLTFTAAVTDSDGNKITTVAELGELDGEPTLTWKVEKKNGNDYEEITNGVTLTPNAANLTASLTVDNTVAAETELKITATAGTESGSATVTVKEASQQ